MKPYLVFKWDAYYPSGGWNDFEVRFETRAQVEAYHADNPLEWGQTRQLVVDGEIVETWRGEVGKQNKHTTPLDRNS